MLNSLSGGLLCSSEHRKMARWEGSGESPVGRAHWWDGLGWGQGCPLGDQWESSLVRRTVPRPDSMLAYPS